MNRLSEFLLRTPEFTPDLQIHDDNDNLAAYLVDITFCCGVPEDSSLISRILLADNIRAACTTPAY